MRFLEELSSNFTKRLPAGRKMNKIELGGLYKTISRTRFFYLPVKGLTFLFFLFLGVKLLLPCLPPLFARYISVLRVLSGYIAVSGAFTLSALLR